MAEAKVLLVEDNPIDAQLSRLMLEEDGCHVHLDVAATGEEALEMVNANPFDAAFVDLHLPGIDGFEVLDGLRNAGVQRLAAFAATPPDKARLAQDFPHVTILAKPLRGEFMDSVLGARQESV